MSKWRDAATKIGDGFGEAYAAACESLGNLVDSAQSAAAESKTLQSLQERTDQLGNVARQSVHDLLRVVQPQIKAVLPALRNHAQMLRRSIEGLGHLPQYAETEQQTLQRLAEIEAQIRTIEEGLAQMPEHAPEPIITPPLPPLTPVPGPSDQLKPTKMFPKTAPRTKGKTKKAAPRKKPIKATRRK